MTLPADGDSERNHPAGPLRLGALGGPSTFGAQAARLLRRSRPEFATIEYLSTVEEVYGDHGFTTDANCVPDQMTQTGFHLATQTRLLREDRRLYVAGEIEHAYGCRLLAKAGAELDGIRRVLGHTGSIGQSRRWLRDNLPRAEIELVHSHSLGAGMEVVNGDHTVACIGTAELQEQLGLEALALDVDSGSVCNYFAISGRPLFAEVPERLVVVSTSGDTSALGRLASTLREVGFFLSTVFVQETGDGLFRFRFVSRWRGRAPLHAVEEAVSFAGARLAGAFTAGPACRGEADAHTIPHK